MASLPDDYWQFDEASQSLSGKRSRKMFQLAQAVEVRLAEARPVTGGLLFQVVGGGGAAGGGGQAGPARFQAPRREKPARAGKGGQHPKAKRRR